MGARVNKKKWDFARFRKIYFKNPKAPSWAPKSDTLILVVNETATFGTMQFFSMACALICTALPHAYLFFIFFIRLLVFEIRVFFLNYISVCTSTYFKKASLSWLTLVMPGTKFFFFLKKFKKKSFGTAYNTLKWVYLHRDIAYKLWLPLFLGSRPFNW